MEKKQFKSESKRLLDLMINSIYTNRDIFLRELISNASDALDKLYYRSLTDKKLKVDRDKLEINLDIDSKNRTITISDNGIGMTREELINNLGTIAKSGTLEFKDGMSEADKENMIGQFGVGFYSAFMVSDTITVTSKSIDSKDAYVWESKGVDGFTIDEGTKKSNGTQIVLHIKEDNEDINYSEYLEEYKIKELIHKYSNYISFPIKMMCEHEEKIDSEDDKPKYKKVREEETLNSMVPIWKKSRNEVSDEDYDNFYMEKFNDYDRPLKMISTSVEGKISYKGLLFIPSHTPFNYYDKNYEKGLSLYSNGVLIMDKCADLLPDYFAFVKGVIDSEDLPLNISRETLQESSSLKLIEKNIDSKIIKELESMQSDDREKYISFFKSFGTPIKYGVYDNFGANKDKLKDLVMFYSNNEDKLITLKEYVVDMKEGQDKIYYASGSSIEKVRNMPQVDQVKDKGYDILLLTEYVDEFCLSALGEYEEKKFINIEKDDLDLETKEEKEKTEKANKESNDMLTKMKEIIGEVEEVRFTNKLKNNPVCLTSKGEVSIEMQKVFDAMPNNMGVKAQMILEINENHKIAEKIKSLFESDKEEFNKYTKILYSEARLIAGLPIDNPTELSNLISDIISR